MPMESPGLLHGGGDAGRSSRASAQHTVKSWSRPGRVAACQAASGCRRGGAAPRRSLPSARRRRLPSPAWLTERARSPASRRSGCSNRRSSSAVVSTGAPWTRPPPAAAQPRLQRGPAGRLCRRLEGAGARCGRRPTSGAEAFRSGASAATSCSAATGARLCVGTSSWYQPCSSYLTPAGAAGRAGRPARAGEAPALARARSAPLHVSNSGSRSLYGSSSCRRRPACACAAQQRSAQHAAASVTALGLVMPPACSGTWWGTAPCRQRPAVTACSARKRRELENYNVRIRAGIR